jgi:hypothetical protein
VRPGELQLIVFAVLDPLAGAILLVFARELAILSVNWGEDLSTRYPKWRGFLMWNVSAEKWMVFMPIFFRMMGGILILIGIFAAATVVGVIR